MHTVYASVSVERNKMHLCATFLWVLCALWDMWPFVSLESTHMSVFQRSDVFFKVKGAPVHVYSIYSHDCLTPLPPWGKQSLLTCSLSWIVQSSASAPPKTSPEWSSLKRGHLVLLQAAAGIWVCPAVFSPDADRKQPWSHSAACPLMPSSHFFSESSECGIQALLKHKYVSQWETSTGSPTPAKLLSAESHSVAKYWSILIMVVKLCLCKHCF